jgi:nicotinamidase/pyrazinamidase
MTHPAIPFDAGTALIVVDVQNDFADRRGSLYVPQAEVILAPINEMIEQSKRASATLVYTQDWHPEHTPHFDVDGGKWPIHCIRDTWGAELHPTLKRREGLLLRKGTDGSDGYSAFATRHEQEERQQHTGLAREFRERAIEKVVVVGLAQDVCVKETALGARREGFDTIVPQATTRPVDIPAGEGQRSLDTMRSAGIVVL